MMVKEINQSINQLINVSDNCIMICSLTVK